MRDDLVQLHRNFSHQYSVARQQRTQSVSVVVALDTMVEALTSQIRALNAEITQLLIEGAWAESGRVLLGIPGLGPIPAAWLLVETLNFSLVTSAAQLTAYAGLAPRAVGESEAQTNSLYQRDCHDAGRLRIALYEATRHAMREHPTIRAFALRLREVGKPRKVVQRAAARKMLHLAWALVKPQLPRRTPD
jgi:transposase